MGEYKHVGVHAEDLADGRMLGPGEIVELDEEQIAEPHNARLLGEGILLSLDAQENPDATDGAIELAEANNVNLSAVTGTGQAGRITVPDVERFIEEQKGGNS